MVDRLPVSEGPPMLYDCEMFVRAKKEVAAASILEFGGYLAVKDPSSVMSGVREACCSRYDIVPDETLAA